MASVNETNRGLSISFPEHDATITVPSELVDVYKAVSGAGISENFAAASTIDLRHSNPTPKDVIEQALVLKTADDYLRKYPTIPVLQIASNTLQTGITGDESSLFYADADLTHSITGFIPTNVAQGVFFFGSIKGGRVTNEFIHPRPNGPVILSGLPKVVLTRGSELKPGKSPKDYYDEKALFLGEEVVSQFLEFAILRESGPHSRAEDSLGLLALAGFNSQGRTATDFERRVANSCATELIADLVIYGHNSAEEYGDSLAKVIKRLPAIDLDEVKFEKVVGLLERNLEGNGHALARLAENTGGDYTQHLSDLTESILRNILNT